jgi:hypothetical protein
MYDSVDLAAGLIVLIFLAAVIWILGLIFSKAGYSFWLGLFGIVPGLGVLICILILAFGDWPVLRQSREASNPQLHP